MQCPNFEFHECGFCILGKTPPIDSQLITARYLFASRFVKDKFLLDVGCGNGYGANILLRAGGAACAIGGDINFKALKYAHKHRINEKLNLIRFDARSLPFPKEQFDVVICFETIEHLDRQEDALSEIRRILKINGLIICSTPNKRVYNLNFSKKPLDPFHMKEFDILEFKTLLNQYFTVICVYGQWFMNQGEIIVHKLQMLLYSVGRLFFSMFPRYENIKRLIDYLFKRILSVIQGHMFDQQWSETFHSKFLVRSWLDNSLNPLSIVIIGAKKKPGVSR